MTDATARGITASLMLITIALLFGVGYMTFTEGKDLAVLFAGLLSALGMSPTMALVVSLACSAASFGLYLAYQPTGASRRGLRLAISAFLVFVAMAAQAGAAEFLLAPGEAWVVVKGLSMMVATLGALAMLRVGFDAIDAMQAGRPMPSGPPAKAKH